MAPSALSHHALLSFLKQRAEKDFIEYQEMINQVSESRTWRKSPPSLLLQLSPPSLSWLKQPCPMILLSQSVESHTRGYHPFNITQLVSTNGNIAIPFSPCNQYLFLPGLRVISQNHGTFSQILVTCDTVNLGWLQEPQSSPSHVCQVEWEPSGVMQWIHCLEAPLGRTRIQGSQTRHSWAPLLCLVP